MNKPILYGSGYSVYVRSARLVLIEKEIEYELVPIDIFAKDRLPSNYVDHHPFGRIPAFDDAGFRLYETGAITRYIDEAFPSNPLQPTTAQERARVNQVISIADSYIYPHLVWGFYVEQVSNPQQGKATAEGKMAEARIAAPICLKALSDLMNGKPWLGGTNLTLADLHVAPMIDYFLMSDEAHRLFETFPDLASWWSRMSQRASMKMTKPSS
ncbi:glutathione S-transferase family protein [Oryzicola mucosus]|uniref:glutathione transferase n=1 Tax=Oryzicola mucosus TaxID=2767425 RepID=A0A8J6PKZ5_9HYPH|nr:glutathione S-transferase family protein [Oryzicola mucosus]MBD0413272.1 glutathione S-transferase family protein [Oryzicola mucosus]